MVKSVNKLNKLSKTKGKMGRPPKLEVTEQMLDQIRALGRIQATEAEAAAVLRVHRNTFCAFMKKSMEALDAYEGGKQEGRASLRRKQFAMAEKSATMQIWLGKQYLGQKDRIEQDVNITTHEESLAEIEQATEQEHLAHERVH